MIQFENVFLRYDTGISLRNLNFEVEQGEFVYLLGDSGSGKSSILKMIYMEMFPNAGSVKVFDFESNHINRGDIARIRQNIGMVFQDFHLLSDRDIYSNLALPLELLGQKNDEVRRQVSLMSDDIGVRSRLSHFPHELSAGEQQRVVMARAMMNTPDILLVDEPVAHLDAAAATDILSYLWKLNTAGTTVVFATHNQQLIKDDPARTLTILSGEIIADRAL